MDTKIALFAILVLSLIVFIAYVIYRKNIRRKTRDAKRKIKQLRENKTISEDFINFPKYYINLDRSEDRRKNMEKEIEEYGLKNIKRVSAFDGKKLENRREGTIDGYEYKNINDKKCIKSEIAITMSHIKAIQEAFKDGHEKALIFEDDMSMTLVPHWKISFAKLLKNIPGECDILLLSNDDKGNKPKIISEKEKCNGRNGGAYIITESGMMKLSKFLKHKSFNFHNYDKMIWDIHIMNDLNVYHSNISLFLQYNFYLNSERINDNQTFCPISYKSLLKYF